jgi:hypothetical protein
LRSLDPHGRAVGSTPLIFVRISKRLTRGQPQVADNSRYLRMTTGVMKTITPNRFDGETTKHCHKTARFCRLEALCSPCEGQRCASPQGPVHLTLLRLLNPRLIHSSAH